MKKRTRTLSFSVTKRDLDIQFFRAGGAGGQHQNKTSSACRIRHPESGAVGECRNFRSQDKNRKEAFRRLTSSNRFTAWIRLKSAKVQLGEQDLKSWLDKQMAPHNLRVETV